MHIQQVELLHGAAAGVGPSPPPSISIYPCVNIAESPHRRKRAGACLPESFGWGVDDVLPQTLVVSGVRGHVFLASVPNFHHGLRRLFPMKLVSCFSLGFPWSERRAADHVVRRSLVVVGGHQGLLFGCPPRSEEDAAHSILVSHHFKRDHAVRGFYNRGP